MAKEEQAKAWERAREQEARLGVGSTDMSLVDLAQATGSNWDQTTQGRGNLLNQGFQETLADELAPQARRFAAGEALQKRVLPRMEVTGDVYENLMDPAAGLALTPAGQSNAAVDEATVRLRNAQAQDPYRQAGSGGASRDPRGNAPSGYKWNPNFNPALPEGPDNLELVPYTGGPADRDFGGGPLGSIERRFIGRVAAAAENTIDDLEYFMSMSPTASVGRFGGSAGMKTEATLLGALMYQAKYQMTSVEENEYNAALGGFSEQLRTLESQGVRGAASIANQFDAMRFEPKDSTETRMVKMARVRQTVENGLAPNLANSSLPTRERQYLQGILDRIAKTIPFTPLDVNEWRRAKRTNPNATLGEVVGQRVSEATGASTSSGTAPPAPPASGAKPGANFPMTNSRGWRKMKDAEGNYAYVGPNGEVEEIGGTP